MGERCAHQRGGLPDGKKRFVEPCAELWRPSLESLRQSRKRPAAGGLEAFRVRSGRRQARSKQRARKARDTLTFPRTIVWSFCVEGRRNPSRSLQCASCASRAIEARFFSPLSFLCYTITRAEENARPIFHWYCRPLSRHCHGMLTGGDTSDSRAEMARKVPQRRAVYVSPEWETWAAPFKV